MSTVKRIETRQIKQFQRKKVAAYARVSVDTEQLMHSLSAQVSYYSNLIQGTPEWEYVGVYIDAEDFKSSFEKGDEMTNYDETVVVYHLPQQGKDITVDIYRGSLKKTGIRLVWDGMYFKRQ